MERRTAGFLVGGFVVICAACGICGLIKREAPTVRSDAVATAPAPPGGATTASSTPAAAAASCDAEAHWRASPIDGDETKIRAGEVAYWRTVTPACRKSAFDDECGVRCDDAYSGVIIEGAATREERTSLLTARRDRYATAAKAGAEMTKRVVAFAAYARSIAGTKRSSAYGPGPGASLDETAEALANGNPCLVRFRADIARIKALESEIDARARDMPVGLDYSLKAILSAAHGCVNCADDRSDCAQMAEHEATLREAAVETTKRLAADNAALAKLTGR